MENAQAEIFFNGLMRRYRERVSDVSAIIRTMIEFGLINSEQDIENDHVAFRTMGVPHLGIESLEKIFLHHGFEKRDRYRFEEKKLDAFWYAPPNPNLPRIFISELLVEELSQESQEIIKSYTNEVTSDPVDDLDLDDGHAIDLFLHSPLWRTPTWPDYQRLLSESEYAAWVIYNRYYLNHFTISVHNLPALHNTIVSFNEFLEANGFRLNDAGGKAKESPDGLLVQSSTVAQKVEACFVDDSGATTSQQIAGSYVEFAERRVLPEFKDLPLNEMTRERRREGFEANNADKIFESTYSTQTEKDD